VAHQPALWPLAVYLAAAAAVAAAMVAASHLLGERHMERGTGRPYESGIVATGTAKTRFDVAYYLVAMFFLVFDVASVFILAWAVALREAGWPGFFTMCLFNGILLVTLAYLWRSGALAWSHHRLPGRRRERPAPPPESAAGRSAAGGAP
jgi:NADH-quinone oxidoreductase subunit A